MPYRFEQFLNARSSFGPALDASGDRLYFLSDMTGEPGLWSVRLGEHGAWPEPLVTRLDRVQHVYPSPVPGQIVVAADVGGDERTQLYLLDCHGCMPKPITDDPTTIHEFGSWHPDGKTIAYSSNKRDPLYFDIYLMNVETGESRCLWQNDGTSNADRFSPDGGSLLVRRLESPFVQAVFSVDTTTGAVVRLTPGGTSAVYESLAWSKDGRQLFAVSDVGYEFRSLVSLDLETGQIVPIVALDCDVDDFALSPNGEVIAYTLNRGGVSEVRLLEIADGGDRRVPLPMGQAYDGYRWQPTFAWLPDSTGVAFAFGEPTRNPEIYIARLGAMAPQRVTASWGAGIEPADLPVAELTSYPTFDGRKIPTFVYAPANAPRDGTRPALFFVHGGPEAQTRAIFNPVIQYFAHRGFTVIAPNVRGSSGYGRTYLRLDDVEKRMDSVRDLAAGAEWAAKSGLADPKKIAVIGGSYGGFMVLAALTTNPELWAAGVDLVGIANFVTFLEQTSPWRRHLREAEYGSLERHRAFLESISPLHKADRIVAPLFVVHGANDPRVPIGEAEQIVASLRSRDRPVEYLRYEDEGHGLIKLGNKLDAYPKIADFLERHLEVAST